MHARHPFRPTPGVNSQAQVAVGIASSPLALPPLEDLAGGSLLLQVVGTDIVFVRLGIGSSTVTLTNGTPLRPGQTYVFARTPGETHINHIAAAATSTLYVTAGQGF